MSDTPTMLPNETTQRLINQENAPLNSVRRGVGLFAFISLAILSVFNTIGVLWVSLNNRTEAREASTENCEVQQESRALGVELLNRLTAPRILGPGATPEQIAIQEKQNDEAKAYREERFAMLKALNCGELEAGKIEAVLLPPPEPPPLGAIGATGEQGVSGLTGPAGPQGLPGASGPVGPPGAAGPIGTSGSVGADGRDGFEGKVGPAGPQGPQGPPAPTTTTPPTTTPPTTNPVCNTLPILCP